VRDTLIYSLDRVELGRLQPLAFWQKFSTVKIPLRASHVVNVDHVLRFNREIVLT